MHVSTINGNSNALDENGLLWAFALSPLRRGGSELLNDWTREHPCWLHFNLSDMRALRWLERAPLPEFARELLLDDDPRIRLRAHGAGLVAVLGDLHHDFARDQEEGFGTLRLFCSDTCLISARRHPLKTVDRVRRELHQGMQASTPVELLRQLIESLADTFADTVSALGEELDRAEDGILLGRIEGQGTSELGRARRIMARLRRHITADRNALLPLPTKIHDICVPRDQQSMRETVERLDAVAQDLELVQERARLLHEEIAARFGEAMNRNVLLLSLVSVALLPITLITGIFGMNVGGMPFSGTAHGFWWVMGGMLAFVVSALGLMHWRNVL